MSGAFRMMRGWWLRRLRPMEMKVVIAGMQGAGKTSLLQVLLGNNFSPDSTPTIGCNIERLEKGNVTLDCWDISGQPQFRKMRQNYYHDADAIVFIVDLNDISLVPEAKYELYSLVNKEPLSGIPLLVLGSKYDLPQKLSVDELIDELDLAGISDREVCCYGISSKDKTNLEAVIGLLMRWARR